MRKYLDQADCYIRLEPVRNIKEELSAWTEENTLCTNLKSYTDAMLMLDRLSEYENAHRRKGTVYMQREAMKLTVLLDNDLPCNKHIKFIRSLMEHFLNIHRKLPWIAFLRIINDAHIVTIYYSERDYFPGAESDPEFPSFFSSRKVLRKADVSRRYFVTLVEYALEDCGLYLSESPVLHKLNYSGLCRFQRHVRRRFNAMIRRIESRLAEINEALNKYFSFTVAVAGIFKNLIHTLQRRIDSLCSVKIGRRKYPALQNPDLVERNFMEIISRQANLCFNV